LAQTLESDAQSATPLHHGQSAIPPISPDLPSSRSFAGIALLLAGFVLLVLSDATAKLLTESLSFVQVVCIRAALLVTSLSLFLTLTNRREVLHPGNLRLQLIRGTLACGSVYLFILGISYVQLAEAAAAAYLGPIIMTALAPVMLGERVGIHRWSAVILGFVGMLIMLRPSPEGIVWAMLIPAGAAVFGALRDLLTRKMRSSGHPISVLLYSNLIIAGLGLPFMLWHWQPLTFTQASILVLSAALIGCAHLMHIQAFRLEEASVLAPFRYTGIIWGVLFGYLFWGDLPDRWVVVGAIIVITSGLYIYWREQKRSTKEPDDYPKPVR
jgi:drug/metabolite transporter (DMT)-like permease